jgi:hypothetical protein
MIFRKKHSRHASFSRFQNPHLVRTLASNDPNGVTSTTIVEFSGASLVFGILQLQLQKLMEAKKLRLEAESTRRDDAAVLQMIAVEEAAKENYTKTKAALFVATALTFSVILLLTKQ